jgi:bacillithiol synthase
MESSCSYISYVETGFFSKIVSDYLNHAKELQPFYQNHFTLEGIEAAIKARQAFPQQRNILVEELKNQYQNISISSLLEKNIEFLSEENTFTITTAHQPNIFTGPLYFIYKILHAIKIAQQLSKELPAYNFVPVYYMGSEDADIDEIGTIFINGEKYQWQTNQTGAVGRMKVDKAFIALIDKMHGQIGNEKYGEELISIFKKYYKEGSTIQQATLELVNEFFGEYGLIVLIPDNKNLKRIFIGVVKKELTEQFSYKAVEATIAELQKHYKVQAGGRELNLFYLNENKRDRIEFHNSQFTIHNSLLTFSQQEILNELETYPERFSANVILRGVFQETVLPNIIFIGGGGEIAYWLELKRVFEAVNVPYPVLILRNSLLLVNEKQKEKISQLCFESKDFFKDELYLINKIVEKNSTNDISLEKQIDQLKEFYQHIKLITSEVDNSLPQHVEALQTKALQRIIELEKKMLRAERKKFDTEQRQIQKLRSQLFPNNSLQERTENIAGFYAKYGKELIKILLENSLALEQKFCLFNLE